MTYSLYVHIPFCAHRCAYCDFNTYAGQEARIPAYVEALCREVRAVAEAAGGRLPAHTVFFGGGTPSLLAPDQVGAILAAVRAWFDLAPDAEISLEANPGTLTFPQLRELRALGVNRLSFGVQSANAEELRLLERIHDFGDVIRAVEWSRRAGFENINLDLIYGLPAQEISAWQATLEQALALRPEHFSLYALTIERGTPFARRVAQGSIPAPDPDAAASMLAWAEERLAAAGYLRYEISNWSLPGRACRHNLTYWRNRPYLGFGAGAHGCAGGYRLSNVLRIQTYIERLGLTEEPTSASGTLSLSKRADLSARPFPFSPATVNHTRLSPRDQMQETMLLGLRLTEEGVLAAGFRARFGAELADVFGREVGDLLRLGLVEWYDVPGGGGLRLTARGRQVGNQAFLRFVD